MLDMLLGARVTPAIESSRESARLRRDPHCLATAGAVGLLGEILARLPGVEKPMIQIVPSSPSRSSMRVARALAVAAAERHSRSLLLSLSRKHDQVESVRGLSWLMSELRVDVDNSIMPDAAVPKLYYGRVGIEDRGSPPLASWLDKAPGFSAVVLDSPAIAVDARTIAMARECHGTIIVVAAGVSRLDEVSTVARHLSCAGVRLLGTVLYEQSKDSSSFPYMHS